MKDIIVYSLFLILPMISFAADEKSPHELNLEIEIVDNDSGESISIFTNSEKLNKYDYFKNISHDKYRAIFSSKTKVSAFKKIIDFVNDELQKLEADDLLDLILLTLEYDVAPLGHLIAESISDQVYDRLNKKSARDIILDGLDNPQFENFYDTVNLRSSDSMWVKNIQHVLRDYVTYLVFYKDPKGDKFKRDIKPNVLVQCHAIEQEYQKSRAENNFEEIVQELSSEIIAKVNQSYVAGKGKNKSTTLSFPVPAKYAHAVKESLTSQLFSFNVTLNVPDWSYQSDLCNEEHWPYSLGGCFSSACGLCVCLNLSPLQILTCNYFGCCNNCCHDDSTPANPFSTQLGGLVRHCVYKTGSCGKRWIILEPKKGNVLENSMPAIESDMFRGWSGDV